MGSRLRYWGVVFKLLGSRLSYWGVVCVIGLEKGTKAVIGNLLENWNILLGFNAIPSSLLLTFVLPPPASWLNKNLRGSGIQKCPEKCFREKVSRFSARFFYKI